MVGRRRVVQNEIVAKHMRRFFRSYRGVHQLPPQQVAEAYGRAMWSRQNAAVVDETELRRRRFTVSLATEHTGESFETITKRATLISDTLLLSHTNTGQFHRLGVQRDHTRSAMSDRDRNDVNDALDIGGSGGWNYGNRRMELSDDVQRREDWYGMYCPDLPQLGEWILSAEDLLKAGLVWYLPGYATGSASGIVRSNEQLTVKNLHSHQPYPGVDYLIEDGRAIDASGANPIKSGLVRPVLSIDLPFVDGVGLRDFSAITVQEFGSYTAFRDFLRQDLLELGDALNDVQSERELVKHGLRIKDEIRAVQAEMMKIKRKRAVAVSGAAIGTVGAVLVAVYGPAMQAAIAAAGASGGLWGIIHAATENSIRTLRENKWYYVWVLARKHNRHII